MPKGALTLVTGRAVNAADRPLATLIESCLEAAEVVQAATLTRASFWTRLYDGAARGNPLARHLAERESVWLTAHECAVGALHGQVSTLALYLRAEGYL